MNEIIGYAFITLGIFFDFLGCIGLLRLPDVYNRLQAAAKCVTLGTCGTLLGVFIINGFSGAGIKAILAMIFVILTAPAGAQALVKASYKAGIKSWKKRGEEDSEEEEEIRETA